MPGMGDVHDRGNLFQNLEFAFCDRVTPEQGLI